MVHDLRGFVARAISAPRIRGIANQCALDGRRLVSHREARTRVRPPRCAMRRPREAHLGGSGQ